MTWQRACDLNGTAIGEPLAIRVAGIDICVVRTENGVFAVRDECTHGAVPLSEGEVDGGTIECWLHGSRFDLRTGAALSLPATDPVRTFPVRVIDGLVHVDVT